MPPFTNRCDVCGNEFQAQRRTSRYCGGTCRSEPTATGNGDQWMPKSPAWRPKTNV